ncbi:hypothetical protein BBJ28_00004933 [Nothophytophthora sp. Chile5]|nr:hypothetical protein BBJ28_00004933 [Nothophytophthora sp. Chile5]
MARRAAANSDEQRRFRRLAARLGVSRHVLAPADASPRSAEAGDARGSERLGVSSSLEPPVTTLEDDDEDVEDEAAGQSEGGGSESDGEADDGYAGELSLTLPSDSASEGLSSDLSLPHSFGHYDHIATGRPPYSSGISQFDDHLSRLSPPQLTAGRASRLEGERARALAGGSGAGTSPAEGGSETVMKKFYEIQVGKIRAQLTLSTQTQRELERTLQQERKAWQERTATLEQNDSVQDRNRLEKESEQLRADLLSMKKRLKMEKTHLAALQISDALAEQLARQKEEDLSVREYMQLTVHSKVRTLETELEHSRRQLEELRTSSSADRAVAAGATDEVAQIQRIAEAKERRLQHDLELSEATRKELESQTAALITQLDVIKDEQRQNEAIYSDRKGLQLQSERLKKEAQTLQSERDDLKSRVDENAAASSEMQQQIALLTADKTFLLDAKAQLEEQEAKLRVAQRELQSKVDALQEKHDGNTRLSLQVQNETRLHFETKLDDEMSKFMELSKREIDRIRNDGQIVYERENRLLKETRDDALKHVEVLQTRLDSVQSSLDEKVRVAWRERRFSPTVRAPLTVEAHKEEFARLETTSTTRITQLEAALEVEVSNVESVEGSYPPLTLLALCRPARTVLLGACQRNKLKEYELLEIDLDGAVMQTGAIAEGAEVAAGSEGRSGSKLHEVMTTFGAIPTTTKRRLSAATQRCHEAQTQLQELRVQYQHGQDANSSLRQQLQQLLTRRGDLDALKATVQVLRGKLQTGSSQNRLQPANQQHSARDSPAKPPLATGAAATSTANGDSTSSPSISPLMKVSPPPSLASKMTRPPTPQHRDDSSRGFASSSGGPDAALKADFKRWLRKEVVLLAALTVAGVTGIQVYQAAERYFKQAIKAYDRHRGRRELSKTSDSEAEDLAALDREIPGVLFNYAQLLMAQKRWSAAGVALQRAKTLARLSSLSEDHVELIEGAIDSVRAAKAAEAAETEGQL